MTFLRLIRAFPVIRSPFGVFLIVAFLCLLVPMAAYAQSGGTGISATSIFGDLMDFLLWITSFLVYASGVALNAAAYYSVVKMGEFVNSLSALSVGWSVFRDLGNITLVFGFVAIGIATILDIESYSAKKMLVMLIIVAVAINFSSLIARGVIDTGNIVALQFYKSFNDGKLPDGKNFTDNGISNELMKAVHLTNLYDSKGLSAQAKADLGTSFPLIAFLGIILFLVVSFVFFSIAILFIARFVILTFLITISPLAFAAMVVPRFREQAKAWWKALIDNTLVAPLILLLLLISVNIVEDDSFQAQIVGGTWNNVSGPAWPNILVSFGIASGFFLASLLIAKKLSAFGAGLSMKLASYPARVFARGASGFGGRKLGEWNTALRSTRGGRFLGGLASVASLGALSDFQVQRASEQMQKAKFGTGSSYDERRKFTQRRRGEFGIDLDEAIRSGDEAEVRRVLDGMSTGELARSRHVRNGTPIVMRNLRQNRFEEAIRHDEFPAGRRADATRRRNAAIAAHYTNAQEHRDATGATRPSRNPARPGATMTTGERAVRNLSNENVVQLPDAVLSQPEVYQNLSVGQLQAIQRAGRLGDAARHTIATYLGYGPGGHAPGGNPHFDAFRAAMIGPGGVVTSAQIALDDFWTS